MKDGWMSSPSKELSKAHMELLSALEQKNKIEEVHVTTGQ